MRHVWSSFALHRYISLEDALPELGRLFGSPLDLDVTEIDEHCKRIDLKQKLDEETNQFVAFSNVQLQTPMVLCSTGNNHTIMLFISWIRAQGVILWPLKLDTAAMVTIADAIGSQRCYDTRLVFELVTQGKHLKKIEIEVDKQSFRALAGEKESPLQKAIIPYIYERSGLVVDKLPLVLVTFTGVAAVSPHEIIISFWNIQVLRTLLECIQ